jgi:metallo-beta-lactamase class B
MRGIISRWRTVSRAGVRFAALAWLGACMAGAAQGEAAPPCAHCAEWNEPQAPFRIFGNTYYVGVKGLTSILITSPAGHVLIDGGSRESPPQIAASIRELGFRIQDVKLILNSHVHYDHAGGIAELQRLSGARVAASPWSAEVLKLGRAAHGDPQLPDQIPMQPVARVEVVADGQRLSVGPIELEAHFTPGHTPGGTSWTWRSCEKSRCLAVVYADSLSAVASDGFSFLHSPDYPAALGDFERSFATLAALPCDILLTPHPELADILQKHVRNAAGGAGNAFIDPEGCRRYVEWGRGSLRERIAEEKAKIG